MIKDLEPTVTGSLVVDGRINLLQVDSARTFVTTVDAALGGIIGPLADLEAEKRAVFDGLDARDALGATDI